MNPGPAISADASQPLGSRRRASTVSATTRGGFPACRASMSARLVARSPNFRSAGTSTVKGGGRSTGSSPAVIASISAWRRSASRCCFIPVRTAPKPVAGIRREHGPGRDHGASLYRLRNGPVKRIRGPVRCSRAAPPRAPLLRCPRTPSLARGKAAGGSTLGRWRALRSLTPVTVAIARTCTRAPCGRGSHPRAKAGRGAAEASPQRPRTRAASGGRYFYEVRVARGPRAAAAPRPATPPRNAQPPAARRRAGGASFSFVRSRRGAFFLGDACSDSAPFRSTSSTTDRCAASPRRWPSFTTRV